MEKNDYEVVGVETPITPSRRARRASRRMADATSPWPRSPFFRFPGFPENFQKLQNGILPVTTGQKEESPKTLQLLPLSHDTPDFEWRAFEPHSLRPAARHTRHPRYVQRTNDYESIAYLDPRKETTENCHPGARIGRREATCKTTRGCAARQGRLHELQKGKSAVRPRAPVLALC